MESESIDRQLFTAISRFVGDYDSPFIAPFIYELNNWGDSWQQVGTNHLPAAEYLDGALEHTNGETDSLVSEFCSNREHLRWEQSYKSTDNAVGEDMLAGYGFAEIVGQEGPFISNNLRTGIGVWGPNIVYPIHQHQAEEIYIVLAGGAAFCVGDNAAKRYGPGELIHVASMTPHGFHTEQELLVVLYLWRAGDLREKSTFLQ